MTSQINNTRTTITKGSLDSIFQLDVYVSDEKQSSHWSTYGEHAYDFVARIRDNGVKAGTDLDKCLANLQQQIRDFEYAD